MWFQKRNKIHPISAIIACFLVCCASVVANGITDLAQDREESQPGVAKIGFDNAYEDLEEKDAENPASIQTPEAEAMLREDDENEEIIKVEDKSDDVEDMEKPEDSRKTALKELANSLSGKVSFQSNSQELRGKEKRLIPLEDDSSSSETRSLKQQGVPFFIADDGKSIQLPQSDVIYNIETGEIVIRNRITEKMKTESEITSAEMKPNVSKSGFFNIRPDGIGFKNLQGFVIADNEPNSNKPFLYPVTEGSKEIDSQETILKRRIETQENERKKTIDDTEDGPMEPEAAVGKNDEAKPQAATNEKTDDKVNASEVTPDSQKTTSYATTTEANLPILMPKNNLDVRKIDSAELIMEESSRSGKQVMNNANERGFKTSQEKDETGATDDKVTVKSDDEPVYKFPITTERGQVNKWSSREAKEDAVEDAIKKAETKSSTQDSVLNENAGVLLRSALGETKTRIIEYDPQLFEEKSQPIIHNTNPIKKVVLEDLESAKKGDGVVYAPTVNPIADRMEEMISKSSFVKDGERVLGSVDETIKKTLEEVPGINAGTVVVKSQTTTEQLDPLFVLRNYLEDIYLRGPIAIVVDVEPKNLLRTKDIWTSMESLAGNLNTTDAVLFGYDSNGITSMSYHKGIDVNRVDMDGKSLANALYGMTPATKYSSTPGNPRLALNKAAQLLPYDSAIFLFEGEDIEESNYSRPTPRFMKQLITKRIKLYTVASNQAWSAGAAQASGGAALGLTQSRPGQRELRALSVYYDSSDEEELVFDDQQTILIVNEVEEPRTFRIPIDSSIRSITYNISEIPQYASLEGPEGIEVDLLDPTSVGNFSKGSLTLSADSNLLTVRLILMKSSPDDEEFMGQSEPYQGIWRLTIISNTTYDLMITAESRLRIMAKLVTSYLDHGPEVKILKIAVGGTVASIQEAEVLDANGKNLTNLVYGTQEDDSDTIEIDSLRALESGTVVKRMNLPDILIPGTVFRIQIEGRNDRDEPFVRISAPLIAPDNSEAETLRNTVPSDAVSGKQVLGRGVGSIEEGRAFNSSSQQVLLTPQDGVPLTTIQLGTASRLHGAPGSQLQIHFEVTNNRENAIYFRFGAKDDQYFLRTLLPVRQWINAGQTANVVVTVGITSTAENNVRDTITFTANGLEPTTLSTYVYVETDGRISSDTSRPSLKHDFRGDCQGHLGSDVCKNRNWGLDIIARDTDSGLMRIAVSPGSLVYQSGFYGGSREESRAKFTTTCCTQSVVISATDVAGNIASYEVNVAQYFTPATIAAIVLGVLLFIALVIVLGLLIRMCIRRRRESRDLPSYQTQRATRTP